MIHRIIDCPSTISIIIIVQPDEVGVYVVCDTKTDGSTGFDMSAFPLKEESVKISSETLLLSLMSECPCLTTSTDSWNQIPQRTPDGL